MSRANLSTQRVGFPFGSPTPTPLLRYYDWLTYLADAQVKASAQAYKTPLYTAEDVAQAPEADLAIKIEPDPAIAPSDVPRIAAGEPAPLTNGHATEAVDNGPASGNADTDSSVATITADSQWDTGNDLSMSISQEWVSVPLNLTETDSATPGPTSTVPVAPSWAERTPARIALSDE